MNELDQKTLRMTTAPVKGLVIRLAIPSIAIMLISSLYNMADTFFVGQLGTSATAAVGVVFSLMAIIQAIGYFFGHGAGNYVSRKLGANEYEEASRMVTTGVLSALVVGVFITLIGFIFLKPLAKLLGATDTILPHAIDYMRFILIGAPWMTASLTLNNQLRYQGSAVYGMIGMVAGAVLNVGLDPLFIFTFNMGTGGAALATMLSQFVGFCLLVFGCSRKGNIRIKLNHFSPSVWRYKEIIRGGFPSLCRQGLNSVSTIFLNQMAGGFGDAAIAAISIVQRLIMFASSAILGFGHGFQPVCGFNYGAKKYDRAKQAFWFCVKLTTGILLVLAVLGFIFAPQLIALFRADDKNVISIGSLSLRMNCVLLPLLGWTTMQNMIMQNLGKVGKASLLATARQGLFLLPALFILTPSFGLFGIQLSQPVADFATLFLSIPLGISVLRELDRKQQEEIPGTEL